MRLLHLFSCFLRKDQQEKDRLLYHYVYKQKHKKALKILKQCANPNTLISYNQPLDLAIHYGDLDMIRILIYHGAQFTELSRMFCRDCRNNHEYIHIIYDSYQKIQKHYLKQICLKYKIPPGLDNYLIEFI